MSDPVFLGYNGQETDKCYFHRVIFSKLLLHGRLSLPGLEDSSYLTNEQLQHGLITSIQQHLVYHITKDNCTAYEANPEVAYYYLRPGKIIYFAEDKLGQATSQVIEKFLYLGYTSVSHLEALPESQNIPNQSAGNNTSENSVQTLYTIILDPGSHVYIIQVKEAHF